MLSLGGWIARPPIRARPEYRNPYPDSTSDVWLANLYNMDPTILRLQIQNYLNAPFLSTAQAYSIHTIPLTFYINPTSVTMAHALIFGASGISGWSLLNQTRHYPSPTTFARITGTTNRPLTLEQAQIPSDERIKLVSGVNLTNPVDEVVVALKEKVPDIDTVTHVFFTGMLRLSLWSKLFKVRF